MVKTDKIKLKLAQLRDLASDPEQTGVAQQLKHALADRNRLVVAKAAEVGAQKLCYELIPELLKAYQYFLLEPVQRDKTCAAKRAVVRALYGLAFDDAEFYIDGIRYTQAEPVWGGSVDTAVDLRCTCGLGLAATDYPRVMIELVNLLNDPEVAARVGAVQAIELTRPYEAEIVLRQKILQGDTHPGVTGQCFCSLLKVEAEQSVPFVAAYLQPGQDEIREYAALALGESRQSAALKIMIQTADSIAEADPFRQVLYRSIALQRNEQAYAYLLRHIESAQLTCASDALQALAIFHYNDDLRTKVLNLLDNRRNKQLNKVYQKHWVFTHDA